jgi:hypothetical protein
MGVYGCPLSFGTLSLICDGCIVFNLVLMDYDALGRGCNISMLDSLVFSNGFKYVSKLLDIF